MECISNNNRLARAEQIPGWGETVLDNRPSQSPTACISPEAYTPQAESFTQAHELMLTLNAHHGPQRSSTLWPSRSRIPTLPTTSSVFQRYLAPSSNTLSCKYLSICVALLTELCALQKQRSIPYPQHPAVFAIYEVFNEYLQKASISFTRCPAGKFAHKQVAHWKNLPAKHLSSITGDFWLFCPLLHLEQCRAHIVNKTFWMNESAPFLSFSFHLIFLAVTHGPQIHPLGVPSFCTESPWWWLLAKTTHLLELTGLLLPIPAPSHMVFSLFLSSSLLPSFCPHPPLSSSFFSPILSIIRDMPKIHILYLFSFSI